MFWLWLVGVGAAEGAAFGASEAAEQPWWWWCGGGAGEETTLVDRAAAKQLVPGVSGGAWLHLYHLRVHAGEPHGVVAALLLPRDAGASAPGPVHPPQTSSMYYTIYPSLYLSIYLPLDLIIIMCSRRALKGEGLRA